MSSQQSLYLRSLLRALEFSDGPDQLAAKLRLSAEYVRLMLNGAMHVPEEAFFRVADLLIDRAVADLGESAAPGKGKARQAIAAPASLSGRGAFEFKWLAVDKLKRLTAEQKDSYVIELTQELGIRSPEQSSRHKPRPIERMAARGPNAAG